MLAFSVVVVLGFGLAVAADSASPGDLLYALDRQAENLQLSWAGLKGDEAMASKYLSLADERMEELDAITGDEQSAGWSLIEAAHADTDEDVEMLLDDYEDAITKAGEKVQAAQDGGADVDEVLENIAEATLRHEETLLEVYDRVPEQAKPAIERAMQAGANGHKEALQNVSQEQQIQVQNKIESKKSEVEEKMSKLKAKGANTPDLDEKGNKSDDATMNKGEEGEGEVEQEQNKNTQDGDSAGENKNQEQEVNSNGEQGEGAANQNQNQSANQGN